MKKTTVSTRKSDSKKTSVKKTKKTSLNGVKKNISNALVMKLSFVIFGIILLLVGGWLWWDKVYQNPTRVFWGMIDNNLATTGITRTVEKSSDAGSNKQVMSFSFGENINAHNTSAILSKDDSGQDDILTESIQTAKTTFVRYVKLKTTHKNAKGQQSDFSSIEGKWATQVNQAGNSNGLSDEQQNQLLLGGTFLSDTVPFGNFKPADRKAFVKLIKKTQAIKIVPQSYGRTTYNGHHVYEIDADIGLLTNAEVLEVYLKGVGLRAAADYVFARKDQIGGDPIRLRLTIDTVTRQLLRIRSTEAGNELTVNYQLFGVSYTPPHITTSLTSQELQSTLAKIEGQTPTTDTTKQQ